MLGSLAWADSMRHATYVRQVLLTAVLTPGVLMLGLWSVGAGLRGVGAALRPWPVRAFLAAVWGHALLAWLSLSWTAHADATLDRAVVLLTLAAWSTAWVLAAAGSGCRGLVRAHLVVVGLVALVGAGSHSVRLIAGDAPARLGAPIANPNTVAVLMLFVVPAGAALAVAARGLRRIPPVLLCAAGVTTFVFAQSRSGRAGMAVAILVALLAGFLRWLDRSRRSRWWAWGPLAGGAIVMATFLCLASLDGARVRRFREWVGTGSLGARYYGTVAGLGILAEHPLLGAGGGTFMPEASRHIPVERGMVSYAGSFLNVAHNEYAESAAELGALGLLCFVALLAAPLWGAWRTARAGGDDRERCALATGLCAAMAGVAVSSLADPSFRYWDFTGIFYSGAALAVSAGGGWTEPAAPRRGEPGALPRRRAGLLAMGFVCLSGATWVCWSMPDARREQARLTAHRASLEVARLKAPDPDDGSMAPQRSAKSIAAILNEHARAGAAYRLAVLNQGYFLSRVQAHYDWVTERLDYAALVTDAADRRRVLDEAGALALQLDGRMPENPLVLRLLATARAAGGDRCGALDAFIRAGRRDPFGAAQLAGWSGLFGSDMPANDALCQAAASAAGVGKAGAAVLRSLARAAAGDWAAAAEELNGVPAEEVDFLALGFWHGVVLRKADRPGQAVSVLGEHLGRWPVHADGWRELAKAHAAVGGQGATQLEIAALQRCLSLDVEQEQAVLRLARVLADNGRRAEALRLMKRHLPIARRVEAFVLLAAQLYVEDGRPGEAGKVLAWGWRRTRSPRLAAELQKFR